MNSQNRKLFTPGTVVQHFKRTMQKYTENSYLYLYMGEAKHTETGEEFVIYRAMYGELKMCARPKELFYSKVDREKYPDVEQEYRFEAYIDASRSDDYGCR